VVTYYGWRVRFRFRFDCGCSATAGPILQKFAYQYARLGAAQKCKRHGAREVERSVEKIDGPHGEHALGIWQRSDGTRIFLTWEPATGWVTAAVMVGRYPRDWPRVWSGSPTRRSSAGFWEATGAESGPARRRRFSAASVPRDQAVPGGRRR
jgi:hypothetical protein